MYDPTYSDLTMEFYKNMLESSLNPKIIILKVKGQLIDVTPGIIVDILGFPNSSIILMVQGNDKEPILDYNREFGFPNGWNGKNNAPMLSAGHRYCFRSQNIYI